MSEKDSTECHNSPFAHSAPSESCWGLHSPNPALPLRGKEKRLNRIFKQSVNFSKRGVRFLPIFLEVYEEVFTRARYMGAETERSDTHSQMLQHAPPQPSSQNTHDRGGIRRLCRPPCTLRCQPIRVYPPCHSRRKHPSRCHRFPGQ